MNIGCSLGPGDSTRSSHWDDIVIGHVRYINILTWLRGFRVQPPYLVLFSLYPSLFWQLRDKGNLKNLQFWPESLGAMLEYWYQTWPILNVNSPYCLPYTSYFFVEFDRFPNFPGPVAFFLGLSSPGKGHNKIPGLCRTRTNLNIYRT